MDNQQLRYLAVITAAQARVAGMQAENSHRLACGVSPAYVSNFERDKYVPEYAKTRIDGWIARQEPA
jgi:hypothetical protein